MLKNIKGLVFILLTSVLLSACGKAHVKTDIQSADLHQYQTVFINNVDIHSQEEAAKNNAELQNKMIEWESFARTELENHIKNSSYLIVKSSDELTNDTLVLDLDVDLVYGNRAARYFGGFGAGKGSVDSILTVSDKKNNDVKFQAVAKSDLTFGMFGGDMQEVLKTNIKELIQQYPLANNR